MRQASESLIEMPRDSKQFDMPEILYSTACGLMERCGFRDLHAKELEDNGTREALIAGIRDLFKGIESRGTVIKAVRVKAEVMLHSEEDDIGLASIRFLPYATTEDLTFDQCPLFPLDQTEPPAFVFARSLQRAYQEICLAGFGPSRGRSRFSAITPGAMAATELKGSDTELIEIPKDGIEVKAENLFWFPFLANLVQIISLVRREYLLIRSIGQGKEHSRFLGVRGFKREFFAT